MSSTSEREEGHRPPRSKKDFIYWQGGVVFGGFMTLTMTVVDLVMHPERYYPLWPLTPVVAFSWLWMLVGRPAIFFGAGCLYGLAMWAMLGRSSQAVRDE